MAAPVAAAGAAKAAGAAGGGGAASGGSAGSAAGAKAAGGKAGQGKAMSKADAVRTASQSSGGGGGDEEGNDPGFNFTPSGDDVHSNLKLLLGAGGLFFFLVLILPMMWLNAAQSSCLLDTSSGGAAGDWATAGKLVGASTFTGDMGYRGDMLNEHLAFAELGHAGATVGDVMGNLPHNTKIRITRPDGSWVIASKMDVGSGGGDVNGHPREIDIHVKAAEKLGLPHPEAWLGLVKYKIVTGAEANGPQWGGPSTDASGSGEVVSSTPGSAGYIYPLATQGERGGGVADHMARPFGNWMSDNAVDILTHPNTDVVAVGDGVIYRQSGSPPCPSCNPAGWTLYLRSGGHSFAYMHLNSFSVHEGEHVKQGQVIGKSGTANSVDHLHFAASGMNPETIVDGTKAGGGTSGGALDVKTLHDKFGIPTDLPPIYVAAAEKYDLGPRGASVLAAINRIETNFGELSTATSSAGAVGWMQFMPATWATYGVDGDGDGVKDPTNKFDAIYAAANYLKASGAPGNWHDAVFAYNHAEWYVDDVLQHAAQYEPYLQGGSGSTTQCSGGAATGPANLQEAVTVRDPAKWVPIPAAIGDSDEVIDARILPAATWIANTYHLHITQGGWQPGSPSVSHGWGTAIDMVPDGGRSWDDTALRLAKDLGWTPDCAASGEKPACKLVPAIYDVYYNGYPGHGDPDHAGSAAHLHIQFECACSGTGGFQKVASWVKTFPIGPTVDDTSTPKADRPKKKKGNNQ